jgi:hypothetical protein
MVIKDLKQTCAQCRGSGRQAGVSQWGITQINPDGRCLACAGRGFVLTALGQELLDLLRPFLEEIVDARHAAAAKSAPKRSAANTPGSAE